MDCGCGYHGYDHPLMMIVGSVVFSQCPDMILLFNPEHRCDHPVVMIVGLVVFAHSQGMTVSCSIVKVEWAATTPDKPGIGM
jgi:hypothetical protein